MSRFFGTASDSDTESEISEEEVPQKAPAVPTFTVLFPLSHEMMMEITNLEIN